MNCKIESIIISNDNVRKEFSEKGIEDLSNSIRENGIIVPLIVRKIKGNGKYELVCGERRMRAAKKVGLTEVPVVVKELEDQATAEYRVIENLQRVDVNAIEEADGFKAMIDKFKYTHNDLALKVGKSQTYVYDRIILLSLDKKILDAIRSNVITPGHGKVLLRLEDLKQRRNLFNSIIGEKLSVRSAENELKRYGCQLNDAVFDRTQCKTCPSNGSTQKDFFDKDTNLKAQCLNSKCYSKKTLGFVRDKIKELKKKGEKVITAEYLQEKGIDYYNTNDLNGYKRRTKNMYKEKCKKCDNRCYIVGEDYDGGPKIEERCINSRCFNRMIYSGGEHTEEKSKEDTKKRKVENRRNVFGRVFWINNISQRKITKEGRTSACAKIMLETISWDIRLELLKSNNFTKGETIEGLRSKDLVDNVKLMDAIIKAKLKEFDNKDLELLCKDVGIDIKKDFVITEDYLKALTKDDIINLSKEIGLDKYLESKKDETDMEKLKKKEMIKLFFKSGFKLEGRVPKEMRGSIKGYS